MDVGPPERVALKEKAAWVRDGWMGGRGVE